MGLGDVNLGRSAGQILLKGDAEYPFAEVRTVLQEHDIVFANLESQIADLGGETQHPKDRYRFCAPPEAARALRLGGISVVSTSNNHAFDYGLKALRETIDHLEAEGVPWTGTAKDSVGMFPPAIVVRNGIRVGFLAYTEFVNRGKDAGGRISVFTPARMRKEIQALRKSVDLVVVSYHGGAEYVESPPRHTAQQMRMIAEAGADIVLGHHPHVPQGLEVHRKAWIFHSLGNFVFLQPQREWTQKSFGVSIRVVKAGGRTEVESVHLLPVQVSNQPTFSVGEEVQESVWKRLERLSSVPIKRKGDQLVVSRINP